MNVLAQFGLTLLSNLFNSKDIKMINDLKQKIKKYTGIDLNQNINLSQEDITKLKQFELINERELIKLANKQEEIQLKYENLQDAEITKRIQSDNQTDVKLTKIVRPLAFISLIFTIIIITLFNIQVNQNSLELLKSITQAVITLYITSRGAEKALSIYKGSKI